MEKTRTLDYWRTVFPEMKRELISLFEEIEIPQRCTAFYRQVCEEKPDAISQELWDNFFIKDKNQLKNTIERFGDDTQFMYVEIDDINYCFFRESPSICVAIPGHISSTRHHRSAEAEIDEKLAGFIGQGFLTEGVGDIELWVDIAEEVYGEENVLVTYPYRDAHWAGVSYPGNRKRPYIIIRHDDFWVKDQYGLSMKVINGLTAIRFSGEGKFDTSSASISFASHLKDVLAQTARIVHPHVPPMSNYTYVKFRSVCKGRNSPINSAISAYVENPTEENLFNFFLNYNNLLGQEDEQGTPHIRMRSAWLKSSRNSVNIRRMQTEDIFDGIDAGLIDLDVTVTEHGFKIQFPDNPFNRYIEEKGQSDDDGTYLLKPTGGKYYRQLKGIANSPRVYTRIPFNGDNLEVGLTEHDPDRFDMSGMEDSSIWKSSSLDEPTHSTKRDTIKKIQSIINLKLMQNNDDNPITKEDIKEELLGITEIRRNTNIGDILDSATPN